MSIWSPQTHHGDTGVPPPSGLAKTAGWAGNIIGVLGAVALAPVAYTHIYEPWLTEHLGSIYGEDTMLMGLVNVAFGIGIFLLCILLCRVALLAGMVVLALVSSTGVRLVRLFS